MLAPEEKQCCTESHQWRDYQNSHNFARNFIEEMIYHLWSLGQVISFSLEGLFLSRNANDKNASSGISQLMAHMISSEIINLELLKIDSVSVGTTCTGFPFPDLDLSSDFDGPTFGFGGGLNTGIITTSL
jgi:hypothetical protein